MGSLLSWLLRLRYRLRVQGLRDVLALRTPILFLFEHPAQVDAFLHGAVLRRALGKRKLPIYLCARDFTLLPLVSRWIRDSVIPVPEETPRLRRKLLLEMMMKDAIGTLRAGRHLALSPVGALLREGRTLLDKQSGTAQICQAFAPGEITIVTTKFEGLYGSSTSRALTNQAPDSRYLLLAIRAFLKGCLVLGYRREVLLRFEVQRDFPLGKEATVEQVNGRLRAIFHEKREPAYVPYNRLDRKALPQLPPPPARSGKASEPFLVRALRRYEARLLKMWTAEIAAFPQARIGILLPEGEVREALTKAVRAAGKEPVPASDPSLELVLTEEAYLDALAEREIVFPQWERARSLVDIVTLIGCPGTRSDHRSAHR